MHALRWAGPMLACALLLGAAPLLGVAGEDDWVILPAMISKKPLAPVVWGDARSGPPWSAVCSSP